MIKKINILTTIIISFAFASCGCEDNVVAIMTFEMDGSTYTVTGGGVSCMEIFDAQQRTDIPPVRICANYFLMGESSYGGPMQGTDSIQTEFFLQDFTFGKKLRYDAQTFEGEKGFFIYFTKTNKVYEAYSGYITLENEGSPHFDDKHNKAEEMVFGNFELYLRNYYNHEDTIFVTNGMYRYNYTEYAKYRQNVVIE
ncbi:hypothetical protein FACS189429_6710 [Bacteroidia bacterium]|nr:hypothetical protein FACS189429_6710 [Bacteroidia bacterium]